MKSVTPIAMNIEPGVGYGPIRLGMSRADVETVLGPPETSVMVDEQGDTILRYCVIGIASLCFDRDEEFRLTAIELDGRSRATLWGKKLFECRVDELEEFLKARSAAIIPVRDRSDALPDKLFRIEPLSIDLYTGETGCVENVAIGVVFTSDEYIAWPITDA